MTGEMSKDEVTREIYPLHFACADQIEDARVEPFDQYQGPYIFVPDKGRFFLSIEADRAYYWWSEAADELSGPFCNDLFDFDEECDGISAFLDLIENGGEPVDRSSEG